MSASAFTSSAISFLTPSMSPTSLRTSFGASFTPSTNREQVTKHATTLSKTKETMKIRNHVRWSRPTASQTHETKSNNHYDRPTWWLLQFDNYSNNIHLPKINCFWEYCGGREWNIACTPLQMTWHCSFQKSNVGNPRKDFCVWIFALPWFKLANEIAKCKHSLPGWEFQLVLGSLSKVRTEVLKQVKKGSELVRMSRKERMKEKN